MIDIEAVEARIAPLLDHFDDVERRLADLEGRAQVDRIAALERRLEVLEAFEAERQKKEPSNLDAVAAQWLRDRIQQLETGSW